MKDRYDFDIVLSIGAKYERGTPSSPPPLAPLCRNLVLVPSMKPSDNIKRLMHDAHLVDVCFVFPSNTTYANIGLWAHRAVLRHTRRLLNSSLILKRIDTENKGCQEGDLLHLPFRCASNPSLDPRWTCSPLQKELDLHYSFLAHSSLLADGT